MFLKYTVLLIFVLGTITNYLIKSSSWLKHYFFYSMLL